MRGVWVTRPREDAYTTAVALAQAGYRATVMPVLEFALVPPSPATFAVFAPCDGVRGLVFTSANGVRAFAHHRDRFFASSSSAAYRQWLARTVIFAVGDATAACVRAQVGAPDACAGFHNAQGDFAMLAATINAVLAAPSAPFVPRKLWQIASVQRHGKLQEAVTHSVAIEVVEAYAMHATSLPAEWHFFARDIVLAYSVRSAQCILAAYTGDAELPADVFCISPAVARVFASWQGRARIHDGML